jgi:DHA1 family bicyclomycin/chloramphenicol resistance-like MFS transporter
MISPASRGFVFMLAAMNAMTALAVDTSLPAMPAIGRDFAAAPDQVQLTLSLFMFGYAFGQILAGPLSDRFGRRPMLLIGLSVYTLAGLGCALADSIGMLILLRTVQALAAAVGPSMSRAIIRDFHIGPRASHMLSSVQLAMGFALVAAPIVGSLILTFANWRGIFFALALFGAGLTLVVWRGLAESLTLPDPQAVHPARLIKNFVAFFSNRVCVGYALINGFIQGGLLAFISGIPFVMTDVFHVPPTHFGFYFALAATGLIFGASLNRRLVRRVAPERILRGGLFVQATAGCVLLLLAWLMVPRLPSPIIFMLPVMAYSFSQGLVMPNAIAGAMEPLPYMAGFAAALLGAVQMASGGVTGYIVNALYNGTALPLAGTLALLACCGLAAYHLVIYRRAAVGRA